MRSIFPNAEAIFGFNSGAPLGYRIAPGLDKYLQSRNSGLTREDSFSHYIKPYGLLMTAGNKSTLCDQRDSALQYLKKYTDIENYISQNSDVVPVAVLEILSEIIDKKIFSEKQNKNLISQIQNK